LGTFENRAPVIGNWLTVSLCLLHLLSEQDHSDLRD